MKADEEKLGSAKAVRPAPHGTQYDLTGDTGAWESLTRNDCLSVADRARGVRGIEYALRLVQIYKGLVGGDPVRALVFLAAIGAVSRNLGEALLMDKVDEDGFLLPEFRKPISISALARSLDLPFETTRRHVVALCAADFLERTADGGVVSTKRQLASPIVSAAMIQNVAHINGLIRRG